MVGKAWADGATPRAYTTRALDRTMREVDREARELATAPAPVRTSVTPVSGRVTQSLRRMAEAVRSGDRGAVKGLADTLAADALRLRHLADAAAGAS